MFLGICANFRADQRKSGLWRRRHADASCLSADSAAKLSVNTDEYGVYEFANVPPGRYTLVAHQEGFADSSQTVQVKAGAMTAADISLQLTTVSENVTVTASGAEQSTFEAIESVDTLNSSQITERSAVGLGDVLDNVAGVSKRSGGGPGDYTSGDQGF